MSCSTIRIVQVLARCGGPAPWCRGSRPRSCRRSARRGTGAAARWRARCRSRGCAARRARGWRPARRPCRAGRPTSSTASRLVDDVAVGAVVAQHAPAVPARLGGDAHVLQHGGVGQDVGDLVERAMPCCEMRSGGSPVMSSPSNRMRPDGRPQHAGQAVEEGALARAVRPDDGADLAAARPSKLTLLSAVRPPKRTVRPSVRRIGGASASPAGPAGERRADASVGHAHLGELAGRRERSSSPSGRPRGSCTCRP